jgi:hypothetical protein
MSIFGSILDKILHRDQPAAAQAGATAPAAGAPGAQQQGTAALAPQQSGGGAPAAQQQATAPQGQAAGAGQPAAPAQPVDVEAVLNGMASHNPQKLNWRTSIVDLMKLLGLDSSLQARQTLAAELHYGGDPNDSAAMNTWLHQAVMQKLADNGGKVPPDLIRH